MSFESVYDISGNLKNLYASRIGEDDSSVGSRESSWSTLSLSRRGSFSNMKKKLRASFRLKPKSLVDKGGEATAADFEKISDLWIKSCTVKGCSLTNLKKISKEFDKRIRAVEVKSKLCLANCDLVDDQILCLCQALAKYPVLITLDLTGNNLLTQKSISHLQDLVDSELVCASTMAGEEYLYCAGFLSQLTLPEHLGPRQYLLKVCGELDLINLRLAIGREYRKLNSPDPLTDEVLLQIWSQISEAPSKNLKSAIQDSIVDHSITVPNNYSFHQAEIILVRGLGKAKQVTSENVDFVRTSSFYKEPMLPPNDPSPAVTPKPPAVDLSTLSEQPTEEEQLQPLSDTVDDYIDTNDHVKNENIDPVGEFLSSPSVDLYFPDPLQNKVISMDILSSPVSSLGHSLAASYFDQPLQASQKPGLGFEGYPSPVSRQPTLKTQQTTATYLTLEQAIPADINDHHVHAYSKDPVVVDTSRVAFDGSLEIEEDEVDEAMEDKKLVEDVNKQQQAKGNSAKFNDTSMTAMDGSRAYLDDDDEEDERSEDPKGFLPANIAEDSHLHTIVEEDNEEDHDEVDISDVMEKRSDISSIQQQEKHNYMESSSVSETLEDNSGYGSQEQSEVNPFSSSNQIEAIGYDQNFWQQQGYYYYGGDGQQYYQEGIAAAADVANTTDIGAGYAYSADNYYGYETAATADGNDPNTNYHQEEQYPTYNHQEYAGATADPAEQQYYDPNNGYNYDNYYAEAEYNANDNNNAYYQHDQGEYNAAANANDPNAYGGYDQQGYYHYSTADENNQYYDYYEQPATTDGHDANGTNKIDENQIENNVNPESNDDHVDVGSDLSSDIDEEEEVEVIEDADKLTGVDKPSLIRSGLKAKDVSLRLEHVYANEEYDEDKEKSQFFYNTQPNQEILRRSLSSSFLAHQHQNHHQLNKIFESVGNELCAENFDVYDGMPHDPVVSETKEEIQSQENPLRRFSSADLRRLSWTTGSRRESFRSISQSTGDGNKLESVNAQVLNRLPETTGQVYSMGDIDAAVDSKQPLGETLTKDLTYYKDLLGKVQASKMRSDEFIKDAEEQEKIVSKSRENHAIQEGNEDQNEKNSQYEEFLDFHQAPEEKLSPSKTTNPALSISAMNTSVVDTKRRQFHSALADQPRSKRVAFETQTAEHSTEKLSVDTSPVMDLNTTIVPKRPPLPKKSSTVVISKIIKDKNLTPLDVSTSQSIPTQVTALSPIEMTNIRHLDLSNSNINDPGAILFSPPTPNNKNINGLVFLPWKNLIILNLAENNIKTLDMPLPLSLKYLDLSKNLIGNPQAIRILSLNQQLQYLDLSDNYRMLQKQNAALVGSSIRSWFPKMALQQFKLLSSVSTNESQAMTASDPSENEPHPSNNNNGTTVNHQIVETYEENYILHFYGDGFVRHIRHWKSMLKPFTVQQQQQVSNISKSHTTTVTSSTSPPKNASPGSIGSVDTVGSALPLSPNSATSAPSLSQEIPSQGKTSNDAAGKLPVVLSFKGDKTDFISIKTRIIQELLATKPITTIYSTSTSAVSLSPLDVANQHKKKKKETKPSAKSTNITPSNNTQAVSIDVQREKDEKRFKYYQKKKENLEKSILQQEKSILSQLKQQSVHKKLLHNTDVKDLVLRLHDTQVSELKRKDEQRKKKEEEELTEKRNALKNVKKMTQKYYDRLTNVSRLSSQEMRSQLELYEQSLLDLEDDLTGLGSGSESDTHSLSSRSSRSSYGSHASSLSSSSKTQRNNKQTSHHSMVPAPNNGKAMLNKIKSKRLVSVQSSPKVLRRKKSRLKDDGVFGMFTRSNHTLTSQRTTENESNAHNNEDEDEEVMLVDDLDVDVDVLVEDDEQDDLCSLSSGRSRSDSIASTVSSISRSSSIGHHHHHHLDNFSKSSNKMTNNPRNKKNLTISVDSPLSSSMLSQGKTGIVKADKSFLSKKGNPLLAPHSYYVAPSLSEHVLPPPPVPLSPTMQSLLPRRNLNSDFDIVNALIQSPSSHMAMRSPKHNGNNLPSSVVHGGNFSPKATRSNYHNNRSLLNSPGASSVVSSTSLISHVSSASSMSNASHLSASFRLQLPRSMTNASSTVNSANSNSILSKQQRKNLHRIAKVAAAGKAVATEATGGLDIPEVNAWAQHSRDALGRCAILLHLLIDLATSASSTSMPLWLNPTYHSICEEWQELGFIFYDTDTTSLPVDPTTNYMTQTTQGRIKPFPGLDKKNIALNSQDNTEAQVMKRASSFHFTASVPRPDFLTTTTSILNNNKNKPNEDEEVLEEEEEEDPWPKTAIAAKALGLDVTKADCEDLWLQLTEYHKLFVQLKSVLDLAVQQQKEEYALLAEADKAQHNQNPSSMNIAAMVKRVLQTPLGQRVNARSGNMF